jgi:hypothetical protein
MSRDDDDCRDVRQQFHLINLSIFAQSRASGRIIYSAMRREAETFFFFLSFLNEKFFRQKPDEMFMHVDQR